MPKPAPSLLLQCDTFVTATTEATPAGRDRAKFDNSRLCLPAHQIPSSTWNQSAIFSDAKCRRATLIGANLPEYPDHVLFRDSTDLTRNRTRNVRYSTADQDRYHGCANG